MRICIISDLHECHREVTIPPAELLLVAGDVSFFSKRPSQIHDFNSCLAEQPVRYRCVIPGNHETVIEADPVAWRRRLSNATLLINEGVTIESVRIWGSPVTPHGPAFSMPNEADRESLWNTIPPVDILMTHIPPQGVRDGGNGCAALRRAVKRLKPRLHCFGHVHSCYGTTPTKHTLFVNAAIVDEDFAPSHQPILLELKL